MSSITQIETELNLLKSKNLFNLIPDYLNAHFKLIFNDCILKNLLNSLNDICASDQNNIVFVCTQFNNAFQSYYLNIKHIISTIDKEKKLFNSSFYHQFASNDDIYLYQRSILVQYLSTKHYDLLNLIYRKVFDVYNAANNNNNSNNEDENSCFTDSCNLCNSNETNNCKCHLLTDAFHSINRIFFELQLFDHLCGDIIVEVVQNKIKEHIENVSLDNYQESFINQFEQWLDRIIIGWIKLIYSSSNCSNSLLNSANNADNMDTNDEDVAVNDEKLFDRYLLNYKKQLAHFMYTFYAHTRINRLFDIIVDYPDSKNAIEDLKICLQKTNLRANVTKSLKTSIEQRLLHPGVNTSDILTAYVSAIKALMILDPSGVMMENVCEPLKRYLRNREDTVKCIVSSLIDESSSELMEEFCKDLENDEYVDSNSAGNFGVLKDWRSWNPDPIDANPISTSSDTSKPDIISMLVNIYGSKDMFVNEYKTLLADRLLTTYSYNMEKEIRYLELLKIRFGDSNLFCCEAMLRDISESKRINTNVLEQLQQKGKVDNNAKTQFKCIILSEQFWPKLKEETIELPNELKEIQEKFTGSYETLKGNRTLLWKNNLGLVTIDIDLGNNKPIEFNVTPIQATVIMKFQEKDTWSLQELSQSLKMCALALRKKLAFWKSQGVLREETRYQTNVNSSLAAQNDTISSNESEVYVLVKDYSKMNRSKSFIEEEDDNDDVKATQVNNETKQQDLHLYWNYTLNMLRGFGCLPLERIHALLKMYANPDVTVEQVRMLLDLKVREQLIKYNAGLYRLNK